MADKRGAYEQKRVMHKTMLERINRKLRLYEQNLRIFCFSEIWRIYDFPQLS